MNQTYGEAGNYKSNATGSWALGSSDVSRGFERQNNCTPNATYDCDLWQAQFYIMGASALWLIWGVVMYYVEAYYDLWLFQDNIGSASFSIVMLEIWIVKHT